MNNAVVEKCLPPNVIGRCHGSLCVSIVHLTWTHQKAAFRSVQVKFIWWGESDAPAQISVHQGRQKGDGKTYFKILTTPQLLQSYLYNCEPLQLKFTSLISNLQIGTASVKIPQNLYIYSNELDLEAPVIECGANVLNFQKIAIGDILIRFEIDWSLEPKMPEMVVSKFNVLGDNKQGNAEDICLVKKSSKLKEEAMEIEKMSSQEFDLISEPSPKIVGNNKFEQQISVKLRLKYLTISYEGFKSFLSSSEGLEFQIECKTKSSFFKKIKSCQWMQNNQTVLIEFFELVSFQSNVEKFAVNFTIFVRQLSSNRSLNQFRKIGNCTLDLEGPTNVLVRKLMKKCPIYGRESLKVKNSDTIIGHLAVTCKLSQEISTFQDVQFKIVDNYSGTSITESVPDRNVYEMLASNKYNKNFHLKENQNMTNEQSACHCDKFLEFIKLQSILQCPRSCNHENQQTQKSSNKSTDEQPEHSLNNNTITNNSTTDNSSQTTNTIAPHLGIHLIPPITDSTPEMLQGLLYLGAISYNTLNQANSNYIKIKSPIWTASTSSSAIQMTHPPTVFNHLEEFPITFGEEFLSKVRCNLVELELWQPRNASNSEQIIGIANLPMNRFFAAYNDTPTLSNVLLSALPIISIDGWVAVCSPLHHAPIAKLQVIFAIGTSAQIENLKAARGLAAGNLSDSIVNQNKLPIPMSVSPSGEPKQNVSTQTTIDNATENATVGVPKSGQQFATLLSNFIDDLASRLPEIPEQSSAEVAKKKKKDKAKSPPQQQVRSTSELMDVLQRALAQPPPTANMVPSILRQYHPKPLEPSPVFSTPHFKVSIIVEGALHLPKVPQRLNKREKLRRPKKHSNCRPSRVVLEVEPSAYVTFEAAGCETSKIKSHEGPVHATNVVADSCNPMWNRRFDVYLPVDLMTNNEKQFILKVWRKVANGSNVNASSTSTHSIEPTPFEDAVVGFTAIDLSVLLLGIPCISGWYNIMVFSGRVNGQMKVSIQPMEDLGKFKPAPIEKGASFKVEETIVPVLSPLSVEVDSDDSNSALGRVLKRKFTELEEISQRLRARLSDVTGDTDEHNSNEINPEDDDEFEHDLNTNPDEDESLSWTEIASNVSGPSQQLPHEGALSVCTQSMAGLNFEDVFKQHDLDTLINPVLMKRLMYPNDQPSTSEESTPRLNADNDCSSTSQESRVRMISNALRRTVLDDDDGPQQDGARQTPEGHSGQTSEK